MKPASPMSSPWEKLLERPDPHGHLVQIYQPGDSALAQNVGRYLWQGLKRREGLLVIATPENQEAIRQELERLRVDVDIAVRVHQLVFFDAQEMLSRFMRAGQPDWNLFESAIGNAMRQVRPQTEQAGLRAY